MARALRCRGGGQLDERGLIERVVRRDRVLVAAALGLLTLLAWVYLAGPSAGGMRGEGDGMSGMAMPDTRPWGAGDLMVLFVMWSAMMVAMMLPAAAPTILLVTGLARRRAGTDAPRVHTGLFLGGYLAAWVGFSAVAAYAQWLLHGAAVLTPGMALADPRVAGALLLFAGLYQWLPIRNVCLTHCRSPIGWLSSEWREGSAGAFLMGARHGAFCLGCCWALMLLLFAAGVMNLVWVAAIAALVLVEKVAPAGRV
ncbi:MAG TPA: DUF2182 domain-containing protein, partial [Gemmatimonadales bacterium]|nr:DUF2182 domain-containing protein [Gemmatimonadales bacterium]